MTARDRRALRYGAIVVVLGFALVRGVPSIVRDVTRLEAEVASKADLLRRARGEVSSVNALADSLALVEDAMTRVSAALLTTDAEHGLGPDADLAARISVAVAKGEARLQRLEREPDSVEGERLRRVAVRAQFTTGIRGLATILSSIETDEALSVQRLQVTAESEPPVPAGLLTVELVVGGWFLMPEAVSAAEASGAEPRRGGL